jgi:cephalosporin-C deacetylase-like acetyl esterase
MAEKFGSLKPVGGVFRRETDVNPKNISKFSKDVAGAIRQVSEQLSSLDAAKANRVTVSQLSSGAELSDVITAFNELIKQLGE